MRYFFMVWIAVIITAIINGLIDLALYWRETFKYQSTDPLMTFRWIEWRNRWRIRKMVTGKGIPMPEDLRKYLETTDDERIEAMINAEKE